MKLTSVHSIKYHRNGVCGAGFYTVLAQHEDEDRVLTLLHTVFPKDGAAPEYYATVDPSDPDARWRGDWFIDDVWKVIEAERNNSWSKAYL